MKRRTILKAAASAGLGSLLTPRSATAADAEIELSLSENAPEISPHIYGHFIEHLGGVIYDGIWVGKESKTPNVAGIRKQFIDDMRQLGAPNIRWPGGCFADDYHWRDGIGASEKRPRTATYWGSSMPPELHGAEPNHFGAHEFMQLCRLTGAAPYLAVNVASGSPQEFHDWVSYCNAPSGTVTLAAERAANGDPAPFNVKYWGVGNEVWGCGGIMKAAEYSALYRMFTSQMPPFGEPYLVACGPRGHSRDNGVSWTTEFLESMQGTVGRPRISGFSMHFYTDLRPTSVSSAESTPEQWYTVLSKGLQIEDAVRRNWEAMGKYDAKRRIRFVIDEWGVWYNRSPEIAPGFNLAQIVTLRDAVHTAMHLDIFNRHADKIAMANVAQTINCLHSLFLAHEDRYARTPVYHVFDMYKPHMGARAVAVGIKAGELSTGLPADMSRVPALSASASVREKRLAVTLTNPSIDSSVTVRVRIKDASQPVEVRATVLTHPDMNAANTLSKPDEVHPHALQAAVSNSVATVTLPAKSVAALEIRLA